MAGVEKYLRVHDDEMLLRRGTHGAKYQPACLPGCLGVGVAAWMYFSGAASGVITAGVLAGAVAVDLAIGWIMMRRDRRVLLDRAAREYRDHSRHHWGPTLRVIPFDELQCVQFQVDHDQSATEYKVKLGRPSVFKVCEIEDDYARALAVAEAVAAFTGLPITEVEEDTERHPEQAREHRERVEAHRREQGPRGGG